MSVSHTEKCPNAGNTATRSLRRPAESLTARTVPDPKPAVSTPQRYVAGPPLTRQGTSSGPSSPIFAHQGSVAGKPLQAGAQLTGKSGTGVLHSTNASSANSPSKKAHWADSCMVADEDSYY